MYTYTPTPTPTPTPARKLWTAIDFDSDSDSDSSALQPYIYVTCKFGNLILILKSTNDRRGLFIDMDVCIRVFYTYFHLRTFSNTNLYELNEPLRTFTNFVHTQLFPLLAFTF